MKTTRYTVDLDAEFDNTLSRLAEQKGTTKAEIIRRALATYSFLAAQAPINSQKKVSITDQNDHVLKDVVLP